MNVTGPKRVFGHMRTACASSQSDQGLRCPLTELLDNIKCMNAEHAWDESESVHFEHARRYIFA